MNRQTQDLCVTIIEQEETITLVNQSGVKEQFSSKEDLVSFLLSHEWADSCIEVLLDRGHLLGWSIL